MDTAGIVSLIEIIAVFGVLIGFGFWQLRDLDRLDREDAEREKQNSDTKG